MAYADQKMSGSKITALIIVFAIHALLFAGLYFAFQSEAGKKLVEKITTIDIKVPEKPKEPPPPPPKQENAPPPIVAPPVKINVAVAPPTVVTVNTPPPVQPAIVLAPPAPVIAPPAPKGPSSAAVARGGPFATDADYPSRALRENAQGVTAVSLSISAEGRVTNCSVTSSSGNDELDQTTCTLAMRRARYKPAMQDGAPVATTLTARIRWVVPKD